MRARPLPLHKLPPFERVRRLREAKGWTQAEAAREYGVSERTWQRYESPGWRGDERVFRWMAATLRARAPRH